MLKNSIFLIMMIMSLVMTSVITISETLQTVFAEKDEDELSEKDVGVLCGASEDYERNQEQCDKLYGMLEEGEIEDDPDFEYD